MLQLSRFVYIFIIADISNSCRLAVTGQLWSLCSCVIQVRLRIQLNSVLFAKTLVRKDVASSASHKSSEDGITNPTAPSAQASPLDGGVSSEAGDGDFTSKAQIMTLMTADVDRCSEFATHMFTLVGTHAICATMDVANSLNS